jgi:hypothetical protein
MSVAAFPRNDVANTADGVLDVTPSSWNQMDVILNPSATLISDSYAQSDLSSLENLSATFIFLSSPAAHFLKLTKFKVFRIFQCRRRGNFFA